MESGPLLQTTGTTSRPPPQPHTLFWEHHGDTLEGSWPTPSLTPHCGSPTTGLVLGSHKHTTRTGDTCRASQPGYPEIRDLDVHVRYCPYHGPLIVPLVYAESRGLTYETVTRQLVYVHARAEV